MKAGILVPVRANSSRFPGKFTEKLPLPGGSLWFPSADHILGKRLAHFFPDVPRWVVYPEDAPVSTPWFLEHGAPAHGRDVMSQLADAVQVHDLDIVILINGDRPLCFLDQCRAAYRDYTRDIPREDDWEPLDLPIVVGDGAPGTGWAIMPGDVIRYWARYLEVCQEHAYGALTSKEAAWAPRNDIQYIDLGSNHCLALDTPEDAQRIATVIQGFRYTSRNLERASSEDIINATYWAFSSYPDLWAGVIA